jgi:hypothetical protein
LRRVKIFPKKYSLACEYLRTWFIFGKSGKIRKKKFLFLKGEEKPLISFLEVGIIFEKKFQLA